jgi:hypothetical protein
MLKNMTVSETKFFENETYTNKWIYNYSNDSIINGRLLKNEELNLNISY